MPPKAVPPEKDPRAVELGEWLMQERLSRGLKRPELVQLGLRHDPRAALTPDYLSKLEYGTRSLASASLDVREAIREGLGVSAAAWEAATGLATGETISPPLVRRPELTIEHDLVVMPVYGLCEAGKPVDEMLEDPEVSPIGVPRKRWRPGALVFRVQGESMQREDGRGIAPDDLVMVDTRMLDLVDGKIYVIHIPGSGVTLKRVRVLGGQKWLFSDNPDQTEFPPFQVDDAVILGRVYSKISVEVM